MDFIIFCFRRENLMLTENEFSTMPDQKVREVNNTGGN